MESKLFLGKLITDAGYSGVADFHRKTKCPVAMETVRRAVVEGTFSPWTLFIILDRLHINKDDMVRYLTEAGDQILCKYIKNNLELPEYERAVLTGLKKIVSIEPACIISFLSIMKYHQKVLHIQLQDEISILESFLGKTL